MSTEFNVTFRESEKPRRGRPPKAPEEKIVQDPLVYQREYYKEYKLTERYKETRKAADTKKAIKEKELIELANTLFYDSSFQTLPEAIQKKITKLVNM